jgi:hypothetical protein
LRGTTAFFCLIYQMEKWDDSSQWNKQVQGADSNSKASVAFAERNIEE